MLRCWFLRSPASRSPSANLDQYSRHGRVSRLQERGGRTYSGVAVLAVTRRARRLILPRGLPALACQGTLRSDALDMGGPRARRAGVVQFRTTFLRSSHHVQSLLAVP